MTLTQFQSNRFIQREQESRIPWLFASFCLISLLIPYYLVAPGPLKSNGTPIRFIEFTISALVLLSFLQPRGQEPRRPMVNPGIAFVLAFFLLRLIVLGVGQSKLVDPDDINSALWISQLTFWAYGGVALYAMVRLVGVHERSAVLACLAIGITFSSAVGILQSFAEVDLRFLFQPPGFIPNLEKSNAGGFTAAERYGALRAAGTALHPIEFSVVAAAGVLVNMHFARFASQWYTRSIAKFAAIVCLVGMMAGLSRSGVVALLTGMLIYMWALRIRVLAGIVGAGGFAVATVFAIAPNTLNALWTTITTSNPDEDGSIMSRVVAIQRVSEIFHANPVFGLGLTTTANSYKNIGFIDNQWLGEIVTGGLFGIAGMAVLTLGGIFGVTAALRSSSTARERDQAFAISSMWAGIWSSSFTFDLFAFQQATVLLFVLLGLLWSFSAAPIGRAPDMPLPAHIGRRQT